MPDAVVRPPIPASCAHRPTVGGVVAPYINLNLADGGVDFRSAHQTKVARCWQECRCQVCGNPTDRPAVLFGGPNQLLSHHFDEPPVCVSCAQYASRACPMVGGRMDRYADRPRVSEGHRGGTCPDPGCACGGWVSTSPGQRQRGGEPAHPYYALYIDPRGYAVTVYEVPGRGYVVNGGLLAAWPLKVVLVSQPGVGRVWRTLTAAEIAELIPEKADTHV